MIHLETPKNIETIVILNNVKVCLCQLCNINGKQRKEMTLLSNQLFHVLFNSTVFE